MKLFLDTEYTGLSQPAPERKLISLALVAEDGRQEWYAELDGWTPADCEPWVQKHVLPLLTGPVVTLVDARASLRTWFACMPRQVQIACDSPNDWNFLLHLLGERPANLAETRFDLAPLITAPSYHATVTAYFEKGHHEHHALHDARAYRLGWLHWQSVKT